MDVLHLNVSGKAIAVLRSTLTCVEGSMLAARFSGRWDDSLEKDRDGNIFINQPADLFVVMIDFLQRMGNSIPKWGPRFPTIADFGGSIDRFEDFAELVEHYGLSTVVLPPTIELVGQCDEDSGYMPRPTPELMQKWAGQVRIRGHYVEARENTRFKLSTSPRETREIRSFEVTLGDVSDFSVGYGVANTLRFGNPPPSSGVGDSSRPATNLPVESGSVIRCELMGSDAVWSVDGKSMQRKLTIVNKKPVFSGSGAWWVSKIEF
jgi:BTB/POZ domain